MAAVNASTRQSGTVEISSVLPFAIMATSAPLNQRASSRPALPPRAASTRLSARNCRISRPPPAPMARRIAISCCRDAARASSKPDRFTQANSRTSATIPISTSNGSK